jgi:hypothetical protein
MLPGGNPGGGRSHATGSRTTVTLVPAVERGEEPRRNTDERELLVSWLEWHRATMARKCDGLAADQLGRRSCPPSELTLLGLARHLTEIERNYFAAWAGIADLPHYYSDEDPDGDFHLPDPVTDDAVRQAFETWQDECDRSRRIVAEADSLDQRPMPAAPHFAGWWSMCSGSTPATTATPTCSERRSTAPPVSEPADRREG